MSDNLDRINSLLHPFGLRDEEAQIYTLLLRSKELSVLQLSRATNISRTKVYTILDKLINLGLVSKSGNKNASRFYSNSYKQFDLLVNQKRSELEMLESSLPLVYEQLASIEIAKTTESKIMHYQGIEGLRTVTWNSTRAKGILRVFEMAHDMAAFIDFDFSERVRIEFIKRKLKTSRQITNFKTISAWTNISEFIDIWECRYIPPKLLKMSIEILIYNDVVTMYQFRKNKLFCIEIYNNDLAEMQKNLFDFVWGNAQKMKVVDKRGNTHLMGK